MTLQETGRVPVTLRGRPVSQINELEWIEGEVFANLWQTDYIVRIDPATGTITGIIDLTELMPDRSGLDPTDAVLNGIAWDDDSQVVDLRVIKAFGPRDYVDVWIDPPEILTHARSR